jgi:hypothetical protein
MTADTRMMATAADLPSAVVAALTDPPSGVDGTVEAMGIRGRRHPGARRASLRSCSSTG